MSAKYTVGYKKPPTGSRFKKGQSGNPRGKVSGTRSFKTELAEELSETVQVTESGEQRTYSKRRLILKSLVAKAIKGDVRAAMAAIKLQVDGLDQAELSVGDLDEADRAVLEDFLTRHANK